MKKSAPLLICLLFLFSCASVTQERSLKDLPDSTFSVTVPKGWWRPEYTNKYLITKDGLFLQYVLIQQRPLDKAFQFTEKKIKSGMLPRKLPPLLSTNLRPIAISAIFPLSKTPRR